MHQGLSDIDLQNGFDLLLKEMLTLMTAPVEVRYFSKALHTCSGASCFLPNNRERRMFSSSIPELMLSCS
ncbi:hypothetical protein AV530_000554 [Patagioenas fasciata monilis]|uniref:Uncharacterized protein n=1 Tax=Patagioenas fasciata monilis TaxID=372326 RepID=A0A1V4IG28_PATFA|nr:hypothetical protein AV530_000554 [Patagioenas fasciata monilis]